MLLIISSSGMSLFSATMGLFFWLKDQGHQADWLSLLSLFGYIVFFALGVG